MKPKSGTHLALAVILLMPAMCLAGFGSDDFDDVQNIRVDLSELKDGEHTTVDWHGYPVLVRRRTKEEIEYLHSFDSSRLASPNGEAFLEQVRSSAESRGNRYGNLLMMDQGPLEKTPTRSYRDDIFVAINVSTVFGCSTKVVDSGAPEAEAGFLFGFYDPCHQARFDPAGRIYKGHKAKANLQIPPHVFYGEDTLIIGLGDPPREVPTRDFQPTVWYWLLSPIDKLIEGARYGELKVLENTLDEHPGLVNTANSRGFTPLVSATLFRQKEAVEFLLERGGDPSASTPAGWPLLCAAYYLGPEFLHALAPKTDDVDISCHGEPLLNAVIGTLPDDEEVARKVQILIDAGANPDPPSQHGRAIDIAEDRGFRKTLAVLRKAGVDQ